MMILIIILCYSFIEKGVKRNIRQTIWLGSLVLNSPGFIAYQPCKLKIHGWLMFERVKLKIEIN